MGRWQREALTEGPWRNRCGPSTIRFANGPPPHGFATGRIYSIVIPAKGVQRHVTLKHDLAVALR
ncbi:DNA polymerase [Sphingopyxis sp. EG6]|nr:DNA polymerase [Sphingopyxis sp. EG6]